MPEPTPVSTPSLPSSQDTIGLKVLLLGDSGTGKTESLATLIKAGVTPFVIATEQNFVQVAKPYLGKGMHYKYIPPTPETGGFEQGLDMVKKINMLSYENLCKVTDPFKTAHNKMVDVFTTMNKFECDCCGKNWGNVVKWGTDRAVVVDSLSGLSDMAFALVVGNKPARALPDYSIAQQAVLMYLKSATAMRCHFILVSHLAREKDEVTGGTTIAPNTVGSKLGPDLPRMFSDVIRTKRQGNTFFWDTADSQTTGVSRHIPIGSNQTPSFEPMVNTWKQKGGQIIPSP